MRAPVCGVLVALAILAQLRPATAAPKGDAQAGVRIFGYCAQCHSLHPGR